VIFTFSSGVFSQVKPVSFVVPALSSETIEGKGTISLSNKGGASCISIRSRSSITT
jgi:hypothetical protein